MAVDCGQEWRGLGFVMSETLYSYWSPALLVTNMLLLFHLIGATVVGLLLGYERSYHGRAAGMRTYALVCVTSTMLTAINAYPAHWYGGMLGAQPTGAGDPTRVIQGIMTGIGFLGAGVIMKDGFTIRGLSSAASIWMTAAIGVIIGVGFYGAAISATAVALTAMTVLGRLEKVLPHQSTLHLKLVYPCDKTPGPDELRERMLGYGFQVVDWSFHYSESQAQFQYDMVLLAMRPCRSHDLASDLTDTREVMEFRLSPSRA
jgi:putative Mg2+ transporter-C (MgtC) family protein